MVSVTLTGWIPGLRKISLTKLIQSSSGTPLEEAKSLVDDLLDGRPITINFLDHGTAALFEVRAKSLGARIANEG